MVRVHVKTYRALQLEVFVARGSTLGNFIVLGLIQDRTWATDVLRKLDLPDTEGHYDLGDIVSESCLCFLLPLPLCSLPVAFPT